MLVIVQGVQLIGERLVLRPWQASDCDALVQALAHGSVQRFTTTVPSPYTLEDATAFVTRFVPSAWDEGGAQFAIDCGDGMAVGAIGVRPQQRDGTLVGILGYWVATSHRRRGLASEALRLVSRWAARNLGLSDQELIHDLANLASCRTALAAGFRPAAVLHDRVRHRDGSPREVELHRWRYEAAT